MKKLSVVLKSPESGYDKVRAIKALRILTGLGLKESKDLIDAAHTSPVVVKVDNSESAENRYVSYNTTEVNQLTELRNAGYTVTFINTRIEALREIVMDSLTDKQYGFAIDVIKLLEKYDE